MESSCERQRCIRQRCNPGGGGVLPYMGYGFSAVLVINRVSILADFGHFDDK